VVSCRISPVAFVAETQKIYSNAAWLETKNKNFFKKAISIAWPRSFAARGKRKEESQGKHCFFFLHTMQAFLKMSRDGSTLARSLAHAHAYIVLW
jgi:guanylate kinase